MDKEAVHITELTDAPEPSDLDALFKALSDFNMEDAGPSDRRPLALFIRDEAGQLAGGLSGNTAWGWLFIQWLWISPHLRGRGEAGRLIAMAEDEARARNCRGAYIDTFNPDAQRAYEKAGYTIFGVLEDFPSGRRRVWLSKRL